MCRPASLLMIAITENIVTGEQPHARLFRRSVLPGDQKGFPRAKRGSRPMAGRGLRGLHSSPTGCARRHHCIRTRLDDRFAAVGQIDIWHAGRKSGGVFGAPCVKAAEPMLGSIIVDFEVIGYGLTVLTVAEDQLVVRLFKMEILHITT